MFLKTADYTVRIKNIGGKERYFIKYHGQTDTPEFEIGFDMFVLYVGEFYHTQENQRNGRRRHFEDESLEHFDRTGALMSLSAEREEKSLVRYDIEAALNGCTEVQRKRFKLHHVHGYTLDEIAAAEKCGKQRIKKSVDAAMEKVKKYFS